jgi:uncharacterized protein (DUF58 family)
VTIADRELETWMLIDRSPRLDFGTASCEKRDLVLGAAAGIGLLTARGGNRVGAMILRGPHVTTVPPRQGRRNLLGILDRILTSPRVDGAGPTDLGAGLRALGSMAPRRGLIAIISDFQTDPDRWRTAAPWRCATRCCACRSSIRDVELPPVGAALRRPATGVARGQHRRPQAPGAVRRAAGRSRRRSPRPSAAPADHMTLSTDGDWLMDLARHVSQRRHRAEATAGRRTR